MAPYLKRDCSKVEEVIKLLAEREELEELMQKVTRTLQRTDGEAKSHKAKDLSRLSSEPNEAMQRSESSTVDVGQERDVLQG